MSINLPTYQDFWHPYYGIFKRTVLNTVDDCHFLGRADIYAFVSVPTNFIAMFLELL